jgi:hypothetical protein
MIVIDQARIDELIFRPRESLNVEVKRWIDPSSDPGISIIVRACFAIRNRNGGFVVFGFDNSSLLPHADNRPPDVRAAFHIDKIQAVISRYAQEPFKIGVGFSRRDGSEHAVIVVPEGVTAPVIVKRDLLTSGKQSPLLSVGDVWFRTLQANGTPSTARALPGDWREIFNICFDNREADIG